MSNSDQQASDNTMHSSRGEVPPGHHGRQHHHRDLHHHTHHRLRQKIKVAALVALGLVVALLAWYLVVTYLDERALGATLRGVVEIFGARS